MFVGGSLQMPRGGIALRDGHWDFMPSGSERGCGVVSTKKGYYEIYWKELPRIGDMVEVDPSC